MNQEVCRSCGTSTAPASLACSRCGALVHGAQLEQIAAEASRAADDPSRARALWVQARALLPESTLQHRSINAKIQELDAQIADQTVKTNSTARKRLAALGPVGVFLWKFKLAALFILTKGKLLLLGLTKISTLLSMFASFGVYWALYGWTFAAGLVISIYIHEMGHVLALRRYGIAASAPMFIPGFGALIRLRGVLLSPIEDARVGLAGPIYGLGAAALSLGIYFITGAKIFGAIAQFGAVINLFNMIPVWQLDGARGFHSLTRNQRMIALGIAFALWFVTSESMLLLVTLGCGYRLFTKDAAQEPDNVCLQQYAVLLVALASIGVFAKTLATGN